MAKQTAQARLALTRERVAKAKADLDAQLRTDEAAAREEARKAHMKHLWTLARALDATGLSAYTAETLAPHFKTLATHLTLTAELNEAPPPPADGTALIPMTP